MWFNYYQMGVTAVNRKKIVKFTFIIIIIIGVSFLALFLFNLVTHGKKMFDRSRDENDLNKHISQENNIKPHYNRNTIEHGNNHNFIEPDITPNLENKALAKNLNAASNEIKKQLNLKKKGGLPVLMYHAIDDKVFGIKEMFVGVSNFEEQMKYLSDEGFTALEFSEINNNEEYSKPIIITFDDGYMDNYTNAYPILKKYKLKATIFMPANFIDSPQYLTSAQMKEMSDIISFQSHSVTHPKLTKISKDDLNKECKESKEKIAKITGKPLIAFSYPFGIYNKEVAKTVSKYYPYAVTTNFGYYKKGDDNSAIKRIGVSYLYKLKDFATWLE